MAGGGRVGARARWGKGRGVPNPDYLYRDFAGKKSADGGGERNGMRGGRVVPRPADKYPTRPIRYVHHICIFVDLYVEEIVARHNH